MGKILVGIGVWLVSDGILSLNLYLNADASWREGNHKQTWRRDHWIRVLRVIVGLTLIIMGAVI